MTKDTKPQGKASVISQADLDRMFGEAGFQSFRDQALFGLMRCTSAKVSEIAQLESSDVFLPNGQVKPKIVFRRQTPKESSLPDISTPLSLVKPAQNSVDLTTQY